MTASKSAETAAQRFHRLRQEAVAQENQSGWLMTFVDLVSLILVFLSCFFHVGARSE